MTRTPKLNDIQLILLATACQRDDGSLLPAPDSISTQGDRIRKAVTALIKRALATEIDVADATRQWRQEKECHIGVAITDAGRAIIAAEETDSASTRSIQRTDTSIEAAAAPDQTPPAPSSKIAMVTNLLRREEGATLTELVEATGWLPHTTRAALTGLRKKGHGIVRESRDGASCYRIAEPA